jgi:hypothetical protein
MIAIKHRSIIAQVHDYPVIKAALARSRILSMPANAILLN